MTAKKISYAQKKPLSEVVVKTPPMMWKQPLIL